MKGPSQLGMEHAFRFVRWCRENWTIETAGKLTFILILGILAATFATVIWVALEKAGQ